MGNSKSTACCELRVAAQNGRLQECQELVQTEGINVSCKDNMWCATPLHEACRYGHAKIVSLLLDHGAELDAVDCVGHTPLYYAAKGGFTSVTYTLIEKGADVNKLSRKGRTPLHGALEKGNKVTTLLLIERGAKLCVKDQLGNTPCQVAAHGGSLKHMQALRSVLESLQSKRSIAVSQVINLNDEKLCPIVRVLLQNWSTAMSRGSVLAVPPPEVYKQGIASVREFLGIPPELTMKRKRSVDKVNDSKKLQKLENSQPNVVCRLFGCNGKKKQ